MINNGSVVKEIIMKKNIINRLNRFADARNDKSRHAELDSASKSVILNEVKNLYKYEELLRSKDLRMIIDLSLRGAKRRGNPLIKISPLQGRGDNNFVCEACKNLFTYSLIHLFTSNKTLHPNPLPQGAREKCAAFTLAETLITLGIIGVIAALTLPSLIQDKQNRELQTGLKKAYSTISQALMLYQAENGEPLRAEVGEPLIPIPSKFHQLKPSLIKYIKNAKDCGFGNIDADTACIKNYSSISGNSNVIYYKTYNNSNVVEMSAFDDGQFILNDNMLILINDYYVEPKLISVDVNGINKKPNRFGQDLFLFQLDNEGRLLPGGAEGTDYYGADNQYCSRTSNNKSNGAGCTVKALSDKDYFKNMPR